MYLLKIINKTQHSQEYRISMQGPNSLALSAPKKVQLSAGEIATVAVTVSQLDTAAGGLTPLNFTVASTTQDNISSSSASNFTSPLVR